MLLSRKDKEIEQAIETIRAFLDGDTEARIECEKEGSLYRLFHAVNSMMATLQAHADNRQKEKDFLKTTIADISHQLKTPLAALNIYNGLLQDDQLPPEAVQEYARLSEQELDRMETLVHNLLKLTRLDAGSIVLEKRMESVAAMMQELELQFSYRAGAEQKTLTLHGPEELFLYCDADWLSEALANIVKNALDHTQAGDSICVSWRGFSRMVQIIIADTGCGIHSEDLPHIFKRFYRSRRSKDTQGIGLGLPLAKSVIEAHGGTIEADSMPGHGTTFTISFLIPTEL